MVKAMVVGGLVLALAGSGALSSGGGAEMAYYGSDFVPVENAKFQTARGTLTVADGGLRSAAAPELAYELSFEAWMPEPSVGAPDFGVGQVWFSVDYGGEFDRLAFAIRGGKMQDVLVCDYAQRRAPSPEVGALGAAGHTALRSAFKRLPRQIPAGRRFSVRVSVTGDHAQLEIDGVPVTRYRRSMTPGRSFCLGGSWQENRFRGVVTRHTGPADASTDPHAGASLRSDFHPNAIKIDFGPAAAASDAGWRRVDESVFAESAGVGWSKPPAGTRERGGSGVEPRLLTLVTLAHGLRDSTFRMDLRPGDYMLTLAAGDAAYGTSIRVQSPAGEWYQADTTTGQWSEIRFPVRHKSGTLDLPMDASHGNGGCVCYLVLEPLDWAVGKGLKPSEPMTHSSYASEHEDQRCADRTAYKPMQLPTLSGRSGVDVSLEGKWLIKPVDEDPASPVDPAAPDADWHVAEVPSFWGVTGWWIFGQGDRHTSQRFLYDELARCERQTFDWRNTRTVYYRQWLDVPKDWAGHRVEARFEAVASACVVYCNGAEVGRNVGMFKPFTVNLTRHLKPGQRNLVSLWVNNGVPDGTDASPGKTETVAVTMPITSDMLRGIPRAIYSSPTGEDGRRLVDRQGGIWQGASLHVSRDAVIEDVWPLTGTDSLDLKLEVKGVRAAIDGTSVRVRVAGTDGAVLIDDTRPWSPSTNAIAAQSQTMDLTYGGLSPRLWSPDTPTLYSLSVDLLRNGEALDSTQCRIGFRTFETRGGQFLLNGKPHRWLGANMAPHGLKPNDRALARKFTALMKESNQSATRTVCSPYPEVWLDEADEQGVAVSLEGTWSWLMIGDSEIPSEESLATWKDEWYGLMKRLRRHPSVVMWTINNETYMLGDSSLERRARKWNIMQDVIREMREIDPTRPIVLWSGYTRRSHADELSRIDSGQLIGRDDGDVDDRHFYAGTYSPSWLGNADSLGEFLENNRLPDRPLITQEAGTAYPNTDTGHQTRGYISMWHSQIWMGNDAYEHRDPTRFLRRHARLTAEQLERVRRLPIAGWLAFCNATWYVNVHNADTIAPYPAHEAVKRALSPVLVALNMVERQFFEGAEIRPKVFVVNDDLKGRSLSGLSVALSISSSAGRKLLETRAAFPDVLLSEMRETEVPVTLPGRIGDERETFVIALELLDSAGKALAANRYEIAICRPSYARCGGSGELYETGPGSGKALAEALSRAGRRVSSGEPAAGSNALWLVHRPDDAAWQRLLKYAEAGGRVLVLDPESISGVPNLDNAAVVHVPSHGECANVANDRTSPLLAGMTNQDLAWWHHTAGTPKVYGYALHFVGDIPENVEILVDHIPPHGYDSKWRVEYPLVRVPVGRGSVTISTMNFTGAQVDPFAARFLCNLVDCLEATE